MFPLLILLGLGAGAVIARKQRAAEEARQAEEKLAADARAKAALRAARIDNGQQLEQEPPSELGLQLVTEQRQDLRQEEPQSLRAVTMESAEAPASYTAVDPSTIRRQRVRV